MILIVAILIGVFTAIHNADSPEAKAAKRLRDAEERAQLSCRAAGCPDDCYYAGMCDRP